MSDKRCGWCGNDEMYVAYHDDEWGRPCYDAIELFELLNLEGAQAGLSWITILRKRDNYRKAFKGFDPAKVARMRDSTLEKLLLDPGIVRNRLKVYGVVTNARIFNSMHKDGEDFSEFLWSFVNYKPRQNKPRTLKDVPSKTAESDAMSKALKKRGFKFCGSTICYAFMQAAGMVNDHLLNCPSRAACEKLGTARYMPKQWPGR